jgi:hypothetical protein
MSVFVSIPEDTLVVRNHQSDELVEAFQQCSDVVRFLAGRMARGSPTYAACVQQNTDCRYVAKIVALAGDKDERSFRVESAIAQHASDFKYGVPVVNKILCEGGGQHATYGILIMERFEQTLEDRLNAKTLTPGAINALLVCLKRMHSAGIWHNDLHVKNIMFQGDDVRIIDFGNAYPFFKEVPLLVKMLDVITWLDDFPKFPIPSDFTTWVWEQIRVELNDRKGELEHEARTMDPDKVWQHILLHIPNEAITQVTAYEYGKRDQFGLGEWVEQALNSLLSPT